MRKTIIAALLGAVLVPAIPAAAHQAPAAVAAGKPVPKEQLLKAPAGADHYVVVSDAGKHGDMWRWKTADGKTAYRISQELRGWISEVDQVVALDGRGYPSDIVIRGVTLSGDAAETFSVKNGTATWNSTNDKGSMPARGYYISAGGVGLAGDSLVNLLAKAGPAGVDLMPSGKAALSLGPKMTIQGPQGPKVVQLAFIRGLFGAPSAVWLDDKQEFFADIGGISSVPAGYEGAVKVMRGAQEAATAAEVKAIAARFLTPAAKAPVLFDNVQLFDADKGMFLQNQAVLAQDGKIARIGAAGSITAPAGAQRIDGRGKTLVPGIWDSHMHIGDDWSVLTNLASGMTSFRSPGTQIDRAQDSTRRRAAGQLLMGEPFISAIIDQKGPLAAQGSEVVTSEAEAIAAVRRIKDAGLWGVKFYTSMNPAWIAPAAAEAKRLGLWVHGHVPATMKPSEAISAGYDELTHINFVVMESMPKDVIDRANTRQRMEGPAKFFKDVDLDAEPMKGFIAELARRKSVVDPTLVIFEGLLTSDGGTTQKAYKPYEGIISPVLDRQFKSGGYPLVDGFTRDDYRKSYQNMVKLVGKLHQAGVRVLAGTDGSGLELIRELEIYHEAGMTPAEVLRSATILPAQVVGADKRIGSIAVGKEADMVLVDGDASRDIGALRRVVTVVSDGYVMDADAMRRAAGFTGSPKF